MAPLYDKAGRLIGFACTAAEIDPEGMYLQDDGYDDDDPDRCPVCGEWMNVTFGCPYRNEPDHKGVPWQQIEKEYKEARGG